MRSILLLLSRKTQIKYENELGKKSGIVLIDSPKVNRENVFLMLIIKAAVIFLVLMGSIDCYMSGFGVPYDYSMIMVVTAAISVCFAAANTNPILTVLIYSVCIYFISGYVNTRFDTLLSGATAIVNVSYKLIMEKYRFPSVDGFEEIIADRSVTVPALIIVGALIMGMIIAVFVCRFMNLMLITVITMLPLGLVLFFDGKPSYSSFIMFASAWILTALIKFSSKFGHVRLKRYMNAYYFKDKIYYKQMCDGTVMLQCTAVILIIAALLAGTVYTLFDNDTFDSVVKPSKTKEQLDYTIRDTMIIAFSNYKHYKITNYVSSGQLGFYGNVEPDFETDLKVTLVPYTMDRIYLRSYIGSDYKYKGNMWSNKEDKDRYINKDEFSATARAAENQGITARIKVENAAVSGETGYMPYYTDIDTTDEFGYIQDDIIQGHLALGESMDLQYHPITDYNHVNAQISDGYRGYVYKNYLGVPKELKLRLSSLCSGQGFRADDDNVDQKIKDYFQNNFTYDLQSGRLPWQTDFVEYFLFETKSGVCAHFASAAVLIYRSIGIPARYAEGYCIDYPTVMEGEPKKEYNTNEWLAGTRPLSQYVMEAELSDYNAHAWVEIYKDGVGWVTVDPTPYVDEDIIKKENANTSLLEDLMLYFSDAGLKRDSNHGGLEWLARGVVMLFKLLICTVIMLIVYILALRPVVWTAVRYAAGRGRDKRKAIIMSFNYINGLAAFCNRAEEDMFYRDFCNTVAQLGMDSEHADKMCRLIEKALYSKNGIDSSEYADVKGLLKSAKRIILKSVSLPKRIIALIAAVK